MILGFARLLSKQVYHIVSSNNPFKEYIFINLKEEGGAGEEAEEQKEKEVERKKNGRVGGGKGVGKGGEERE